MKTRVDASWIRENDKWNGPIQSFATAEEAEVYAQSYVTHRFSNEQEAQYKIVRTASGAWNIMLSYYQLHGRY